MPIYMEISPLHRLVTIVARGELSVEEIRSTALKLVEAKVRRYAKIIEIAGAKFDVTHQHVAVLAQMMRGDSDERGPVAFVVGRSTPEAPHVFASLTQHEGPIDCFHSLREARGWLADIERRKTQGNFATGALQAPAASPNDNDPWSGPGRQGTMFVGARRREVTVRRLAG